MNEIKNIQIFSHLKELIEKMKKLGWVLDGFEFNYNKKNYIVVYRQFENKEQKKNKYSFAKLRFLKFHKDGNLSNEEIFAEVDLYRVSFDNVKEFRNFFEIQYTENLGDIFEQFSYNFSKNIPNDFVEDKSHLLKNAIINSLSKEDKENPNKIYCYKVKRNGKKKDGNLAKRSPYNDNKARLLRPTLYEKLKDDLNVSFCFSENLADEKNDKEILENFLKNHY